MTLPVRLEAGDPAPEAGVLVYRNGPADDGIITWGWLVQFMRQMGEAEWVIAHIQAIADAAAAPRPLREGDRVRVGEANATVLQLNDDIDYDHLVYISFDGTATNYSGYQSWLPIEAVTRIEGDEQ